MRPLTVIRPPRGRRRSGLCSTRPRRHSPSPCPAHRGDRAAADPQRVSTAGTSDDGRCRPRRRPAGPRTRTLTAGRKPVAKPRVTDTVTVSLLDWDDVIDRTALGFDQLKPPGLAEVAVLGADGKPVAPPTPPATGRGRSPSTAATAPSSRLPAGLCTPRSGLRWARCWTASRSPRSLRTRPIALPAGQQELLISPGAAFVVDGAQLAGSAARRIAQRPRTPAADRGVGAGPPRSASCRAAGDAGVGRSGKHQPRLGGTHQCRDSADAGRRQRVAAGLGGARGHAPAPSR